MADGLGSKNTPGRVRTCDRRFRKPLLYPLSYERVDAVEMIRLKMRPAGFEPAACGLGNRRSIHLSYGRPIFNPDFDGRATGLSTT